MKISIGILAFDEADRIAETIRLLSHQSLVIDGGEGGNAVEIVCVPNGCTDKTADVVRQALQIHCSNRTATWRVCELEQAGKPNSWNEFVHSFSDQSADVYVLMDADIDLISRTALQDLVDTLAKNPHAYAVVGMPTKRTGRRGGKSIAERLSLSISAVTTAGPPGLNGGLYCARGKMLRQIWIPHEVLAEDGFVKAMLITDFFTRPDQPERIVRASEAVYEFEPYLKPVQLFRHERRLVLAQAVNCLLYDCLWDLPMNRHAGEFVRDQLKANPRWLPELLDAHLRTRKWWVLPKGLFLRRLFKRIRKLPRLGLISAIRKFPVTLAAMVFELPVLVAANSALRRRELKW